MFAFRALYPEEKLFEETLQVIGTVKMLALGEFDGFETVLSVKGEVRVLVLIDL